MAKRKKRRARVVNPVVEIEEEVLVETDDDNGDEEEVEEAPKPKKRRRKRKVVESEPEDDDNGDDEEDDEEEAPPKPKRKRKRKKKVVVEPEEEEAPKPKRKKKVKKAAVMGEPVVTGVTVDSDELLYAILDSMDDGQSVTIARKDNMTWSVAKGGIVVTGPVKLRGKAFHAEVQSPEYVAHKEEWQGLTFSEKKKVAEKLGIDWEEHDSPKIEVMRITAAVREKLGIEKYKPEYASRAARAAIRG